MGEKGGSLMNLMIVVAVGAVLVTVALLGFTDLSENAFATLTDVMNGIGR